MFGASARRVVTRWSSAVMESCPGKSVEGTWPATTARRSLYETKRLLSPKYIERSGFPSGVCFSSHELPRARRGKAIETLGSDCVRLGSWAAVPTGWGVVLL